MKVRKTKEIVYQILDEIPEARWRDNVLIVEFVKRTHPSLSKMSFEALKYSPICFESITRARRQYFKDNPENKPLEISELRKKLEEEFQLEYARKY